MNWNNINCCHVAIVIGAVAVILAIANIVELIIVFNYSLKLDKRTIKLEKKNGKELKEIDQLKQKIEKLEEKLESRS